MNRDVSRMKFKRVVMATARPYGESEPIFNTLSDEEKEYVQWEAITNWDPNDRFNIVCVYSSCGTHELDMHCDLDDMTEWEETEEWI